MALTKVKGSSFIDGTITDTQFANTTITTADMALDPRDADNYTSGSVPLAQLGNVPAADTTGLDNDIALLGFKTAANGSLAKYNLVDQTVDAFEDASGVDAGASTNAHRDSSGKYYVGRAVQTPTVTGGTITTDGAYTVHKFTADGTYTSDTTQTIEYLVIAGGGGGGWTAGNWSTYQSTGGGGAGEFVEGSLSLPGAAYGAVVGAGGTPDPNGPYNANGEDSTFHTVTAIGGGCAIYGGGNPPGNSGGSGGGGTAKWRQPGSNAPAQGTGGASTAVQGFGNAGAATTSTNGQAGGGGGGAGGAGIANSNNNTGSNPSGGIGKQSDILVSGTPVYYAGGGGAGAFNGTMSGGLGGGGAGSTSTTATPGTANTGGGGGGARNSLGNTNVASSGGSGIVIIRRPTQESTYGNMTLVSNLTAAQAAPTKGDIVFTYSNAAGTAVINTNITAEISADNGSTWTTFSGLTSQGTTGGHTIVSAHAQTITSTITSPYNMRYRIKTLVQSAAMDTRIQAVSLGWS